MEYANAEVAGYFVSHIKSMIVRATGHYQTCKGKIVRLSLGVTLVLNAAGMYVYELPAVMADETTPTNVGAAISKPATEEQSTDSPKVRALFQEAVHLLRVNKAFQARDLLLQALTLSPKSAGVHCNLGLAYQNSGNMNKAIAEYKEALVYAPHMAEATLNLAGCYQSIAQTQDAIEWYSEYLKDNPAGPQSQQVKDIIQALNDAMSKPASNPNLPDYFESITADGVFRWSKDKIPLKIFIEDKGGAASFKPVLVAAFSEWSQATGGKLTFQIVPSKEHADIYCTWTDNPADMEEGNGSRSERGVAKMIVRGDHIERATLKILTRPMFDEGTLSDDEMKKACLHEVGHVLGLQGHSSNNHDVMFLTVDTATVWPVLSKRDKLTINRLYQD